MTARAALDRADLLDDLLARLHALARFSDTPEVKARRNELAQLARRLDLTDDLRRRGAPLEP